jgi:hypothetical protein
VVAPLRFAPRRPLLLSLDKDSAAPIGGMARSECVSPLRQCLVPRMTRRQTNPFLLRSLAEPTRQEHAYFTRWGTEQIPTIFVSLPDDQFDPGLAQASVALSLWGRRMGTPVLMNNPGCRRDVVAGHDEGPRCQRNLRQKYKTNHSCSDAAVNWVTPPSSHDVLLPVSEAVFTWISTVGR